MVTNIKNIFMNLEEKKCYHCNKNKKISEFSRDCSKTDGFYSYCKDCVRKKRGIKKRVSLGTWRGMSMYKSGQYLAVNGRRIHRIIAEEKIGRKLEYHEHVHHINGDKLDNREDNLMVISKGKHHSIHSVERWRRDIIKTDDKKIIEYYRLGLGVKNIGLIMGIDRGVVYRRLLWNDVNIDKKRKFTKETKEILKSCHSVLDDRSKTTEKEKNNIFGRLRP